MVSAIAHVPATSRATPVCRGTTYVACIQRALRANKLQFYYWISGCLYSLLHPPNVSYFHLSYTCQLMMMNKDFYFAIDSTFQNIIFHVLRPQISTEQGTFDKTGVFDGLDPVLETLCYRCRYVALWLHLYCESCDKIIRTKVGFTIGGAISRCPRCKIMGKQAACCVFCYIRQACLATYRSSAL